MTETIRVFVSSTYYDLIPEREAVEQALLRMRTTAIAVMEYFGSRDDTPRAVSLTEVNRSQVYIGLFAHRYGSGITEAEYRRARKRGLPCLVYFKDDAVLTLPAHIERDPSGIQRLDALRDELQASHVVSRFRSPDHLAAQVVADLHNLLQELWHTGVEPHGPGSEQLHQVPSEPGVPTGGSVTGGPLVSGDGNLVQRGNRAYTVGQAVGCAFGDYAHVVNQFDEDLGRPQAAPAPEVMTSLEKVRQEAARLRGEVQQ